jgi:hypothetical protein
MNVGKKIHVPNCVVLFYILNYTCHNGVCFSLEYSVVWSLRQKHAPFLSPNTSTLFGPEPTHVPDQGTFNIWCETILPLTLVREPGREWLVLHITRYHAVSPHL